MIADMGELIREPEGRRHRTEEEVARPARMLLIDTCGAEGTLALAERRGSWRIVASEHLPGRRASEMLLPGVRRMLEAAGWRTPELSAVAVVHGPGSFTGLRVGVSAAKGLAEGGGVALIALSRLEVLADAVEFAGGRVHALLDAGRGEVYHGVFAPGHREREELTTIEAAAQAIAEGRTETAETDPEERSAVLVCEEKLEVACRGVGARLVDEPTAAGALRLAAERLEAGCFADVATLDGHYLRRTETEIRDRVEAHARARVGSSVG